MLKTLFLASVAVPLALTSIAAQARVTDTDNSFLTQDIQGGRYELALAKLGATKATKPVIRHYAQMVARDHVQANSALTRLLEKEGVDAPGGMTDNDEAMLTKLTAMSGSSFDRAFVDEMNRVNAEDKQSADQEKASTSESAIRSYISRFAAMDAKHEKLAAQLRKVVS